MNTTMFKTDGVCVAKRDLQHLVKAVHNRSTPFIFDRSLGMRTDACDARGISTGEFVKIIPEESWLLFKYDGMMATLPYNVLHWSPALASNDHVYLPFERRMVREDGEWVAAVVRGQPVPGAPKAEPKLASDDDWFVGDPKVDQSFLFGGEAQRKFFDSINVTPAEMIAAGFNGPSVPDLLDNSVKSPDLDKSTEIHKEPGQDEDGMINGRFL